MADATLEAGGYLGLNKETKVINLFAGPCAGKSTLAAGLFYLMKKDGKSCELVQEFAKELTWAERERDLQCQLYVSGVQYQRVQSLLGRVEYIITDSPLLLGIAYTPDFYPEAFKDVIYELWNRNNNLNYFINRYKEYFQEGRNQNEEEARDIDYKILNIFEKHKVPFKKVNGIEQLRIEFGV